MGNNNTSGSFKAAPVSPNDTSLRSMTPRVRNEQGNKKRVLVVGAGDTGKSTLVKQIKLLFNDSYAYEQRRDYRSIIYSNITKAIKYLAVEVFEHDYELEKPETIPSYQRILNLDEEDFDYRASRLDDEMVNDLRILWEDNTIQQMYLQRHKFQIWEHITYAMTHFDRIMNENYIPTDFDILCSKIKTTGVIETEHKIKGKKYVVIDTGGQRIERRKWPLDEQVDLIVFTVSVEEFAGICYEDNRTNRQEESMKLFVDITSNEHLLNVPIALVLNKADMLSNAIDRVDFKSICPDYPHDLVRKNDVILFLLRKYQELCSNHKFVFPILVSAIDQDSTKKLFECIDNLMKADISNIFSHWDTSLLVQKAIPNVKRYKIYSDIDIITPGKNQQQVDQSAQHILHNKDNEVINSKIEVDQAGNTEINEETKLKLDEEKEKTPVTVDLNAEPQAKVPIIDENEVEERRQAVIQKSRDELYRLVALMNKKSKK